MAKLSTFLWFDNQAEEAARFYTSLFADGCILKKVDIPAAGKDGDKIMQLVDFEMNGQTFSAINGGPLFTFNQSISLVIHCETQEELDGFWEKLIADGGQEIQCGWLRDKFGLSWQIVPTFVPKVLSEGGPRALAMMLELREMTKLEIAKLQQAYNQAVPASR